ncbi:Ubiquitin domain-containing CTD phosphatase 1 [Fasciola hepatica]|uniref:Ubiquitin domain-containing CTD phosphatase 1 n=1 Tax=Fasciola hepatica TaxID=6192 RepID=A0A4E0S230_FASHE|nr:Ubiquitin domain-containing CTD phosphatase 1 [Fasciola hepatica]
MSTKLLKLFPRLSMTLISKKKMFRSAFCEFRLPRSKNRPENTEKVLRRSKAYRARKLCEPRPGKHLLVLDVDYTIFDHLTPAESARQLARPYLHEFLSRAYVYYDIAIWSATSMTWILAKLGQLGVIPPNAGALLRQNANGSTPLSGSSTNQLEQSDPFVVQSGERPNPPEPFFRISLLLDSSDMISVHFPTHGVKEVKPLAVIWENHPQWDSHNTIMFDDIRRNFIMNPKNGLRIRSYRDAHVNYKTDRELRGLARYLELIAQNEPDFTKLNHNHWERYIAKCKRVKRQVTSLGSNLQSEADRLPVQDSTATTLTASTMPPCIESLSPRVHQTDASSETSTSREKASSTHGAVDAPGDTRGSSRP